MRLKDIEARLDGDKIKGTLPEELTVEQRQEYLAIYAKLAKLLSDADRFTVMKEKGGLFR
jgi:adenylylsulfate kinase-like enzyme